MGSSGGGPITRPSSAKALEATIRSKAQIAPQTLLSIYEVPPVTKTGPWGFQLGNGFSFWRGAFFSGRENELVCPEIRALVSGRRWRPIAAHATRMLRPGLSCGQELVVA